MATEGKDLSSYTLDALPSLPDSRIGLVVAEWNAEITNGLLSGAVEVLDNCKDHQMLDDYVVHRVPGSYELPLGAQWLFEYADVDAVICIGSVIRGETAHFDFVCQACSAGVKDVGLEFDRPAIFCVLTDDTIEQSRARSGGQHGNKGTEAAVAALKMLGLRAQLQKDVEKGYSIDDDLIA